MMLLADAVIFLISQVSEPRIDEQIRQLQSDRAANREQAFEELRSGGPSALPYLERIHMSQGTELFERIRLLKDCFRIQGMLTPALLQVRPPLDLRLATNSVHGWTELFIEIVTSKQKRFSALRAEDLDWIGPLAIKGAENESEKLQILSAIESWGLRRSAEELVGKLKTENQYVCTLYVEAIGKLGIKTAVPALRSLLSSNPFSEIPSVPEALACLGDRESIPELMRIVQTSSLTARGAAIALSMFDVHESAPHIMNLLRQELPQCRSIAVKCLTQLNCKDASAEIAKLLNDRDPLCRAYAVGFFATTNKNNGLPEVAKALTDDDPVVVVTALRSLGRMTSPESLLVLCNCQTNLPKEYLDAVLDALGEREDEAVLNELQRLSKCENAELKNRADTYLTLRGDTRSARRLLNCAKYSYALNALRAPDVWKKTKGVTINQMAPVKPSQLLQAIGRLCGLSVDWGIPESEQGLYSWAARTYTIPTNWSIQSLVDWIEKTWPCFVILEPGVLKVVSLEVGKQVWGNWGRSVDW